MPDRERKRVPDDRSDVLEGPLPKGPPAHPLISKFTSGPNKASGTKGKRQADGSGHTPLSMLEEGWDQS